MRSRRRISKPRADRPVALRPRRRRLNRRQIDQTKASFERREEDWQLQREPRRQGRRDRRPADRAARTPSASSPSQEQQLAELQQDHAAAVATFLATRFTNAELFEWMSGVLGRRVRVLPAAGHRAGPARRGAAGVRAPGAARRVHRRRLLARRHGRAPTRPTGAGSTGSARLLQDVSPPRPVRVRHRPRKLHLTQTFPLSQLAAFELQQFRETGVLTFATPRGAVRPRVPRALPAADQAGPAVAGRADPAGARDAGDAVGVRGVPHGRRPRPVRHGHACAAHPESIAFTSPINATGLFELEPESGLLLPFEGMGVDTVWQLELPKAANPFDYRTHRRRAAHHRVHRPGQRGVPGAGHPRARPAVQRRPLVQRPQPVPRRLVRAEQSRTPSNPSAGCGSSCR